MADLPTGRYPRLAGPTDISRLISGENVSHVWPPPGTTVVRLGFPASWAIVYGEPTVGDSETWFVTTLAELALELDADVAEFLARFAGQFGPNAVSVFAGTVGQWPVIYQADQGSITMRWIRVTMRGELGSQEQFQHKFDLGNPGADPTLAEGDAAALAEDLAVLWAGAWNNIHSPATEALQDYHASQCNYTEVGVAQFHQDDEGTSANPAGDREQDFPAAWYLFGGGGLPGNAPNVSLPFEVACAVTFQTETYGPRGRGRIYLPAPSTDAMEADGLFSGNYKQVAGLAIGYFFDQVIATTPYEPIVVSSRAKQLHAITSLNVGSVPDSQRRRRRSQTENRTTYWTLA